MNNSKTYRLALILAIALHVLIFLILLLHISSEQPPVLQNQPASIIAASLVSTPNTTTTKIITHTAKSSIEKPVEEKAVKQPPVKMPVASPKPIVKTPSTIPVPTKSVPAKPTIKSVVAKPEAINKKIKQLEKNDLEQALEKEQQQLEKAQKQTATAEKQRQKLLAQQQLDQQLTDEQQQLNASQAAATQGEIDKYKVQIIQVIGQQWLVPANLRENLSCKLLIRLAPKGLVLNVTLVESSGVPVLDRSAIAAVYKASPLPVPDDPSLFDNFRELNLTVKPASSGTD